MRKTLVAIGIAALLPMLARAESWSVAAASGPFIFGHFIERTTPIITEIGSGSTQSRLSAATRAGATVDVERAFSDHLALRVQGTWIRAPLRLKSTSGDTGVTIDAGQVKVTTVVTPLVFRMNRGALQFHLMAGPAHALYSVHRRAGGGVILPLFEGTRGRWGGAAGVGVAWWWSGNFAVEWQASDIVTASPFRREDVAPSAKGIHIPKPQNAYTAIGIRYRFQP